MKRILSVLASISMIFISSCGTPNNPDSIMGDDGGYKIVGKCRTIAFAQDILVKDTVAYVAQGEAGLLIADISNRVEPKAISTLTSIRGYNYKIAIYDSTAYLASGTFGVNIIDITDSYNPFSPRDPLRDASPAKDIGLFSNWLFIATSEIGVTLAENSVPLYPEIRGMLITPGFAQGIAITPDSAFVIVACGETGLAFFNLSQIVGGNGYGKYYNTYLVDVPGYAENVTVNTFEKYAYVACGTGGLAIVDYSDSTNARVISNFNTGGYAKEVFYQNNKIYITTELRGLQIINVSDPKNPVRIGSVATQYAKGVTADDNFIYVADEDEGLIIIKIPH